jgi:hypothetical protein
MLLNSGIAPRFIKIYLFLYILDRFDALILKIIFKK